MKPIFKKMAYVAACLLVLLGSEVVAQEFQQVERTAGPYELNLMGTSLSTRWLRVPNPPNTALPPLQRGDRVSILVSPHGRVNQDAPHGDRLDFRLGEQGASRGVTYWNVFRNQSPQRVEFTVGNEDHLQYRIEGNGRYTVQISITRTVNVPVSAEQAGGGNVTNRVNPAPAQQNLMTNNELSIMVHGPYRTSTEAAQTAQRLNNLQQLHLEALREQSMSRQSQSQVHGSGVSVTTIRSNFPVGTYRVEVREDGYYAVKR